ncbi:uncharacterized protein [Branchiostoma lanceolatum]|uniref:uncharacterized protein n=1 Tax=Branchiostoma lanceolatum TaxID=7740 RepID=UPI003453B159
MCSCPAPPTVRAGTPRRSFSARHDWHEYNFKEMDGGVDAATLSSPAATLPSTFPTSAVQEVLSKLERAGPNIQTWESKLLLPLMKRQLAASPDGKTITCKTGGLEAPIKQLTSITATKARVIVEEHDMPLALTTRSVGLKERYGKIFQLFVDCHRKYSHAKPVSEEDISSLDDSIKAFMLPCIFPSLHHSYKDAHTGVPCCALDEAVGFWAGVLWGAGH